VAIVRIELFVGRNREQKARAAKEIAEVMARTLGTTIAGTEIIFSDVERFNWAHQGKLSDGVEATSTQQK
jgi:phenylpyruvate tautomerase PptA (4-oxalocrotonate tautomerase family)